MCNLTFFSVLNSSIRPLFSHRCLKIRWYWRFSIMINLAGHQMNSARLRAAWHRGLRNTDATSSHVSNTVKVQKGYINGRSRCKNNFLSSQQPPLIANLANEMIEIKFTTKCAGNHMQPQSSAAYQVRACVSWAPIFKMAVTMAVLPVV